MNEFLEKDLPGEWWTAEEPEQHYRGILRLNEHGHGRLTLKGTEDQLRSLPSGPLRHTFFGQLTNRYEYEVSLYNVGLSRGPTHTWPKRPEQETDAEFYTNNILVGEHIVDEETPFLHGALCVFTGLDEWCDESGFSGKITRENQSDIAAERVNVEFKASATPHYDVGGGRLIRFLSEYRGPIMFGERQSMTLTQLNSINLTFSHAISIKQLLTECSIWQSFITLGLRRGSYLDDIAILVHIGGDSFTRLGLIVPGRKPSKSSRRRNAREALLNRSKLTDRLGETLKAWREQQEKLEIPVTLYASIAYQDSNYTHTALLNYLQALEILHRETQTRDRFPDKATRTSTITALRAAIPSGLNGDLQTYLRDQIGFVGSLTLLDRLKHLFSLYPKSLTPLFRHGDQDMIELKDARNFLTHYGDQEKYGRDYLWSKAITVLQEKARLFLEVCLLGAIGMSDDSIAALMNEFEPYRDWRMETSMELANQMLKNIS